MCMGRQSPWSNMVVMAFSVIDCCAQSLTVTLAADSEDYFSTMTMW